MRCQPIISIRRVTWKSPLRVVPSVLVLMMLASCATLVGSMTSQMAGDLADTISNSRDVDTVREGVPAYLLLIDSFLRSSPDNPKLLLAAAQLNGSFSTFAEEDRAKLLTAKALEYSLHAACVVEKSMCEVRSRPFDEYRAAVDGLDSRDLPVMYGLGVAWTSWIQANADDWNAIAELGKVKYLMERVIALDETWSDGGPQLYMGGLETILPASMGGHPEEGRKHFERAIEISGGKYLMTKVIYAQQYARLVFDKELHDRLLREVLAADPVVEGMTFANEVAQMRARELLATSDDYF